MKINTRNLLFSFLLVLAMLLSVSAITPLTAYAIDRTTMPAETIYVGGVALNEGQYVKNGETTATTGAPEEDTTGYAWYSNARILILKDYTYQGRGYEYSSGNYALVYSTGTLEVSLSGENTLKQTESGKDGIYTVGALRIRNTGSLTIEGNSCCCIYSNNIIEFQANLGTVNLKSTGNATAIVSYDNDGDTADEQAIIVYGGDIYVETFYPISDLTINGGGFKVSGSPALSTAPDISAYEGDYTITVSENQDGSNPVTYNQDNISNYNYFRIAPPAKTVINSVSVSGIELPQIGETFAPDETTLTYGGEYTAHYLIEKYTGTEWVEYTEDTDIIEHSVKYRLVLELAPKSGYTFSEDLTDNAVKINGKDGVVLRICPRDAFTNDVEVALEFSYEAPVTDYNITIADKDGSATVGVDITIENYEDVLGDGTVSYNPTTNTLTLNNYVYNGEGVFVDDGGYVAIVVDIPAEGLNIVLVGTNSITVSGSESAGMIFFGEGDLTIKGNGSLSINTIMYGISLQSDSGKLTIENAKLNITTTGAMAICIQATDFVMTSGDVKITASMIGIGTSKKEGICINGGSVEIGTALGGYAFIYLDFEHMTFNPVKPDLSNYVGDYNMTAGVNTNGSDANEFNEGYLTSYKYIKIAPVHVHDYGTTWQSDENNHWNECECGDKANVAPHADENNDGKCDVCDYAMGNADNPGGEIEAEKTGLSGGAIAGIVIGSIAVAGLGGFSIFWFVIKKKKFADLIAVFKKK